MKKIWVRISAFLLAFTMIFGGAFSLSNTVLAEEGDLGEDELNEEITILDLESLISYAEKEIENINYDLDERLNTRDKVKEIKGFLKENEKPLKEDIKEKYEELELSLSNFLEKAQPILEKERDKLLSLIDKTKQIDFSKYTEESVLELEKSLESATVLTQGGYAYPKYINMEIDSLNNAIKKLVEKENQLDTDDEDEVEVDFMDVSSVYPGERINVKFKGKAKTKYAIKVINPSGTANSDDELDELIISDEEGYVVWSYDVGPTTGAGKGKIVISEVGSKTVHTFDYIVEEGKQTEDREDKELILNLTAEATIKDPNSKDDDKDEKETEDIPAPIRPEDGTCKPCEKETVTTVVKPAKPVVNHPTGNSTMGRAPQTGDGGLAFTASTMLLSAASFLGTRKRR